MSDERPGDCQRDLKSYQQVHRVGRSIVDSRAFSLVIGQPWTFADKSTCGREDGGLARGWRLGLQMGLGREDGGLARGWRLGLQMGLGRGDGAWAGRMGLGLGWARASGMGLGSGPRPSRPGGRGDGRRGRRAFPGKILTDLILAGTRRAIHRTCVWCACALPTLRGESDGTASTASDRPTAPNGPSTLPGRLQPEPMLLKRSTGVIVLIPVLRGWAAVVLGHYTSPLTPLRHKPQSPVVASSATAFPAREQGTGGEKSLADLGRCPEPLTDRAICGKPYPHSPATDPNGVSELSGLKRLTLVS
jgi:hypothetical protein